MKSSEPIIILTSGEPAGIGPDICGMLAKEEINKKIVIICDHEIMLSRLKLLNLQVKVKIVKEVQQAEIHKKIQYNYYIFQKIVMLKLEF